VKQWRAMESYECPHCGCEAEVFTSSGEDNFAYDGDSVRCSLCHFPGWVSADEDGAHVNWHDEPGCHCEWCQKIDAQEATGGGA
jgi:hypothetical protein